jgi:hypothetical protein
LIEGLYLLSTHAHELDLIAARWSSACDCHSSGALSNHLRRRKGKLCYLLR